MNEKYLDPGASHIGSASRQGAVSLQAALVAGQSAPAIKTANSATLRTRPKLPEEGP
jgi:hypothetical protein